MASGGNNNMLDDLSSESEGGVIKKVEAFSEDESDSEDCIVENVDSKVKSTGFFHKLKLRDLMKAKGEKKTTVFREGESEEYNSEVDGDNEVDLNTVNYDILTVRSSASKAHTPMLELVLKTVAADLPDDYEDLLSFKRHRKEHQNKADEEW